MPDTHQYPPRWQAWLTVGLLFLASIVSVIDRTLLSIVVDPVKADLGISDVQIGLLQGLAFGLFYATMGLWLGLVADRTNRRNLIIIGIVLWSLATIGGGLAQNFGEFFLSRMLVGLGEASLAPAAISLIADLFPAGKRGRPIGFYLMGQAVANGLSLWIAGLLLGAAADGAFDHIAVLEQLSPWRIVFVICGLAGSLVGFAFFTTKEPKRPVAPAAVPVREQLRKAFGYLLSNRTRYLGLYLGFAVFFLGIYGSGLWNIVMVSRQFDMDPAAVSLIFGPIAIGFGLVGPMLGGSLVDWIVNRHGTNGLLVMLAIVPFLAIPSASAVMAPNANLAIILCASQAGVAAVVGSATLAYLQSAMPSDMRGLSVSLTGLLNTIVGHALGPMLVAIVTEDIIGDHNAVGWGIFWIAVPSFIASAMLYGWAARRNRGKTDVPLGVTADV
ncbi:MFS transporter [Croceicoccus gelatinilyticus]|uniref:MFS transporter n=1 Tax=Croceicoccus gelatinilyticus TaxID=2835536 RepID=UPI001BCAC4D0|nr:MFS transporter [Croceicoccus gelatinilyticus]MBS7669057.1 MFS transporter [Croceicoccus gelatinilyticus]